MLPHHIAWLRNHPDRTEEWLRNRLADGFQVHHLDRDHSNNAPGNLVLIDGDDHMRMHDIPVRRKHLKRRNVESRNPPHHKWPVGEGVIRKRQKRLAARLRAAEELLRQGGWVV